MVPWSHDVPSQARHTSHVHAGAAGPGAQALALGRVPLGAAFDQGHLGAIASGAPEQMGGADGDENTCETNVWDNLMIVTIQWDMTDNGDTDIGVFFRVVIILVKKMFIVVVNSGE